MNAMTADSLRAGLFAMCILAMFGCSLTGSTKDILSSTTPGDWYTEDGLPKAEYKVNVFVAINLDNLKTDMARGQGEYLASLSGLLDVPPQHQPEFFALVQQRYPSLAHDEEAGVTQTLVALSRDVGVLPQARQ